MMLKSGCLYILITISLGVLSCGGEDAASGGPDSIKVYRVTESDIPVINEFIGQVQGFKDIAIRARVEGFLEGIHFQEGSRVLEGDLLYTLESQPFEAEVAAKMSMVAEAKTMLAKAESDLARIRPLAEQKAVSESDLDAAVAMHEAALASLDAANANLRASRIQLSYTKIYSPIDGIIGKTLAKVGDFVGRSPNPVILNVVSRIDTVLVDFFLTEVQFLQIIRYLESDLSEATGMLSEESLEMILADGSTYEHWGKVDFIDRGVDSSTGAILVQASFPNPEEVLRTGLFVRIRTHMRVIADGIKIPQRCVSELQGRFSVFLVDGEGTVSPREVVTGPRLDDFIVIDDGLEPGDMIVYEGLQWIRPGRKVIPVLTEVSPVGSGGQR
jgi:membrane fusion protein (multidrug efflux system)